MLSERLQDWLTRTGTSREELAEKLHVSKRTVDSWLGRVHRPIPATKRATIEALISPKSEHGHVAIDFCFTDEEWTEITRDIEPGLNKEEVIKARLLSFIRAARIGQ